MFFANILFIKGFLGVPMWKKFWLFFCLRAFGFHGIVPCACPYFVVGHSLVLLGSKIYFLYSIINT